MNPDEEKRSRLFLVFLIAGILLGVSVGIWIGDKALILKPFGDLLLRSLFVTAIPLVFFSISSTFASFTVRQTLSKILLAMLSFFIITGIFSALLMIFVLKIFPLEVGVNLNEVLSPVTENNNGHVFEKLIHNLMAEDFYELMSRQKMLALILFSSLLGLATSAVGESAIIFKDFLDAGSKVMMRVISYVMLYAPIGLGCYAAYMVGTLGNELFASYGQAIGLYYGVALLYFFAGFSFYLFLMGEGKRFFFFWRSMIPPAVTAFTLGSSVATIPVSLKASEKLDVSKNIREITIPLGATLHMDGTCLSAVLKIAFAFALSGQSFSGFGLLCSVVLVALLSGIVMGGVPGGGFMSEMMIVSLYGLPLEMLPILAMIGMLVDAPATAINVVGDHVVALGLSKYIKMNKGV